MQTQFKQLYKQLAILIVNVSNSVGKARTIARLIINFLQMQINMYIYVLGNRKVPFIIHEIWNLNLYGNLVSNTIMAPTTRCQNEKDVSIFE